MKEDQETEELRQAQLRREAQEEELARAVDAEQEAAQHKRRAEKARYLRSKLDERAASERDEEG